MFFLLVSLRVAVALPAELAGAWLFETAGDEMSRWFRVAVRRFFWVAGVLPPVLFSAVAFWVSWNWSVAWRHALLSFAVGALLVELLAAGIKGVPCGRAVRARRRQAQVSMALVSAAHRHAQHLPASG